MVVFGGKAATPSQFGKKLKKMGESVSDHSNSLRGCAIAFVCIMLVREPENPYNTNAIDVRSPEGSLGHIGAELTPRYACLLDSGCMRCEGRIAEVTPLSMHSSKCKKALVTIRVYPAKKQK